MVLNKINGTCNQTRRRYFGQDQNCRIPESERITLLNGLNRDKQICQCYHLEEMLFYCGFWDTVSLPTVWMLFKIERITQMIIKVTVTIQEQCLKLDFDSGLYSVNFQLTKNWRQIDVLTSLVVAVVWTSTIATIVTRFVAKSLYIVGLC